MLKPYRLHSGDLVAVLSPSWGGPSRFPATYEAGLRTLRGLGLRIREYPSTRLPDASVDERVADLHAAFDEPEVKAIFASIGGNDAIRLLPKLDAMLLTKNPKIVMGYSDTGMLLAFLLHHGHVAFHGPSVMAGLAQASAFPSSFVDGLCALLFEGIDHYEYPSFGVACEGYESWSDPANATRTKPLTEDPGPRVLQGHGIHRGRLWGGCLETLEMLKGTPWWPRPSDWSDKIVILEGSENSPPPDLYRRALRSWIASGALELVPALLVGRPRGYDAARKAELDEVLTRTISEEAGRPDMIVISNCEFGHTDPQWTLPLGCLFEVDANRGRLTLVEAAVV